MTVHVAMSVPYGAVMFSDSQGSTQTAEIHGLQKQLAGEDFLLGGAGSYLMLSVLFRELQLRLDQLTYANIEGVIRNTLDQLFEPGVRGQLQLILAGPTDGSVKIYRGGLTRGFVANGRFGTIGSGAEFVDRSRSHHNDLGLETHILSLPDAFVAVDRYATASNESLTVNADYLVGFILKGRTYLLGSEKVQPSLAPTALRAEWRQISAFFSEIRDISESIRHEVREALRRVATIRVGTISQQGYVGLASAATTVGHLRVELGARLAAYAAWYDRLLNRPAVP